jgi:glycerol-3-phosphate dehydrogenase
VTGTGRFDVVIIGAGAAGLWTAVGLTTAGASVLLVHAPHPQGYSSTRNQNWLHSGALYAVFRAPAVTRDCIQGSQQVCAWAARHDPGILADTEFRYAFDSRGQADAAAAACLDAGIAAGRPAADLWAQALLGRPAWLLPVPDKSVDSSRLLRSLARQAVAGGANAVTVPSLRSVRLRPGDNGWQVSGPGFSAPGQRVIITAGTLIPELLASADLAPHVTVRPAFEVTATTVVCAPGLTLPAAVVCVNGGPHVIRTPGTAGVTICVQYDNHPVEPAQVHEPPADADRLRVLDTIRASAPGLADTLAGTSRLLWYSCQKLIPAGAAARPGWRNNVFTAVAPGLFVAYAGKFTTAPVLAELVTRQLDCGQASVPRSPGAGTLEIADQPFRAGTAGSPDSGCPVTISIRR